MSIIVKDERKKKVKCVVWDLDNTLWEGILLEDREVRLKENVMEIIKTLDSRGIVQSIASKNDYELAVAKLKEFGLFEYFLYPQISWNSKSSSIVKIAASLNIGIDTIAFVDDYEFELEEVRFAQSKVLCIHADEIEKILDMPRMNPDFITADTKKRRQMYMSDIERKKIEESFEGPQEQFLASLSMHLTIKSVTEDDLQRAEELTVRTNQLNTTGYTYSYEELNKFRNSDKYKLVIASLDDKYGTYGKIGLVLLECNEEVWTIKLLLMSCRVLSRGIGTIMISYILNLAKKENVCLRAEFVSNDRNRMMYVTYKFAGFTEIEIRDNMTILENNLSVIQPYPDYVKVDFIG